MQKLAQTLKTLRLGDLAVRRNPLYYAQACEALAALDGAGLEARRTWTRERLGQALWRARRSAYGRRVRGARELDGWPLLDKASVQADAAAFMAAGWLVARASTGGTSGAPLPLARSWRSVVFEQACLDRMMALLGVDARRARLAVLRGDNVKDPSDFSPPYWRVVAGGRRMILSSNHLNAATAPRYAEALEAFAPDLLWAYPTSLESLCVQLGRARRRLRLARVMTSSEVLRPQVWRLAQATLGCRLLDYYGQAERVAFAYALAPGEYRFLPGYAHVELAGAGSEGEHALYEIVGTSLWNAAMPLVRYRTGDLLRLPAAWGEREREEVSLGLRGFGGVLGRDNDILVSPEGVRLTGIDHFQREVENLLRIQVIQESAREVRILALTGERFGEGDAARLLANARKKLPASMRVRLERVEALERTGQGKTPFVIHRPAVKALLQAAA